MDGDASRYGRDRRGRNGGARCPGLYLVATPIGNARDITLRALDVLAAADVLAAEDTRRTRQLLAIHGLARGAGLVPYHDHNGAAQRPRLLAALAEGRSVALVSDAGTPLVADPGLPAGGRGDRRRAPGAGGARALRRSWRRWRWRGCRPTASCSRAFCRRGRRRGAGRWPSSRRCRRRSSSTSSPRRLGREPRPTWRRCSDRRAARRSAASSPSASRRPAAARSGSLAAEQAAAPEPRGEIVVVVGPPVAAAPPQATLDAAPRRGARAPCRSRTRRRRWRPSWACRADRSTPGRWRWRRNVNLAGGRRGLAETAVAGLCSAHADVASLLRGGGRRRAGVGGTPIHCRRRGRGGGGRALPRRGGTGPRDPLALPGGRARPRGGARRARSSSSRSRRGGPCRRGGQPAAMGADRRRRQPLTSPR